MSVKIKRAVSALAIAILLAGGVLYFNFVSKQIYMESRSHLLEIYSKARASFSIFMTRNWSILKDWGNYTQKSADDSGEEIIQEFIRNSQDNWGFTDFYFLNTDREYITVSGEKGNITGLLGNYDKIADEQSVFTVVLENGEKQVFFAVPTDVGTYMGFPYTSVCISYSYSDVRKMIDISAFSGDTESYVVYSDGKVMFSANQENVSNIIEYLDEDEDFSDKSKEELERAIAGGEMGMMQCEIDGQKNYIVYQPLSTGAGMVLGIIPKKVVNRNMNLVQGSTFILMGALIAVILLEGLFYIKRKSQKALQDKVIENEHRNKLLDMIIEPADDIYIIFDKEYKVKYVSSNIRRIIGIDREPVYEDIHKLMISVMDNKVTLTDERLASIEKGESWHTDRYMLNQKTKELKWYHETIHHIADDSADYYILVLSDRTKEKRVAEQLQSALDSARGANAAKGLFLANMSHDIRTPINAIVGCADLLMRDAADEEKVRRYAKRITSSSRLLLGLINDVLDLTKIESGKTSINIAPFNLADLLEEISATVSLQAKAKGQEFKIIASRIQKEQLLGDKVRLSQILLNLLSNAVKYTQDGGKITFNITSRRHVNGKYQKIIFEVTDNGMGMTEDFLKVIFNPFERMDANMSREIQGTGLGMAITKNLVDVMGGDISVKSELGKGSTFTVELDFQTQNIDDKKDFWKKHGIGRILLVDDEEDISINIKNIMSDTGVDVGYTTDGESAVRLVKQAAEKKEPYDLVLLDWKMPGMDGVETAGKIREELGRECPILILTSFEWDEVEKEARQAGVDGFIPKPFFISVLRNVIERLLESKNRKEPDSPHDLSINGMRFLAVEDYELNYEILKERLEMEGADCEPAANGKIGVEMFENSRPGYFDAILMDVQMPVMNGYDATRAIRAGKHPLAKSIPIVAMTANAFDEDVKKALEAGMNAHIAKPIDMNLLKKVIVELTSKQNGEET